jgi:hypothetical protein
MSAASSINHNVRLVVDNSSLDSDEGQKINYVSEGVFYQPRSASVKSGSEDVSDSLGRSEIDAKIAASEARMETKIVRLEGKIDALIGLSTTISSHQDANASSLKTNIWAATAIIVATILGLFAIAATIGPSAFSFGAQMRDLVRSEVQSQTNTRIGPQQ